MVSTGDPLDWTRPCCPCLAGCGDSPSRAGAPALELSPQPQELDPLCVLPAQPSPHISGFAYPCGPLGTQLLGSFLPWPRDGGPGMLTWDAASIQPASATQETFRHNAVCPASQGPTLHSGPTGRVPRRGVTGGVILANSFLQALPHGHPAVPRGQLYPGLTGSRQDGRADHCEERSYR